MGSLKDHYFGDRPYPETPGFKTLGTSETAARAMRGRSEQLRASVLRAIANAGPDGLTADEAAAAIGESVLSVRPRLTELKATHAIEPTGARRSNASGQRANVWRIKTAV